MAKGNQDDNGGFHQNLVHSNLHRQRYREKHVALYYPVI